MIQASENTRTPRTANTAKTSTTSPYSGHFEGGLNDAGVYLEGHDYDTSDVPEPRNLQEIQRLLAEERASLSPSRFTEEDFKNLKRANAQARSETRKVQTVMHDITGKDDQFKTEADVEFNNILPFNESLAAAKPDSFDGVRVSKIHKQVRDKLNTLIVPSTDDANPVAPNFFLEVKSNKGRADVAKNRRVMMVPSGHEPCSACRTMVLRNQFMMIMRIHSQPSTILVTWSSTPHTRRRQQVWAGRQNTI